MSKRAKDKTVRISAEELITVPVAELVPYEHNARTHSDEQVERLRRSLREFGFVAPILIDEERRVIAGHGRLLAAQAEGMESVPCVRVGSLTEAQRRAYILADNRLAEDAGWDEEALRFELDEIAALDFDVSLTGFDVEPGKPIHVREHDREKAGRKKDAPEHFWGDDGGEPETDEEYDAFVDKFRRKLTTDDCYTGRRSDPPPVLPWRRLRARGLPGGLRGDRQPAVFHPLANLPVLPGAQYSVFPFRPGADAFLHCGGLLQLPPNWRRYHVRKWGWH